MPTVNLDTAARLDIICRKGDSFSLTVEFDQDLPSGTYNMQVRPSDDDNSGAAFLGLNVAVSGGDAKKLEITASPSDMNKDAGLYVYDVQYKNADSSTITTYLFGTFEIKEDVTVNT